MKTCFRRGVGCCFIKHFYKIWSLKLRSWTNMFLFVSISYLTAPIFWGEKSDLSRHWPHCGPVWGNVFDCPLSPQAIRAISPPQSGTQWLPKAWMSGAICDAMICFYKRLVCSKRLEENCMTAIFPCPVTLPVGGDREFVLGNAR